LRGILRKERSNVKFSGLEFVTAEYIGVIGL
jgi:hypothetical protein